MGFQELKSFEGLKLSVPIVRQLRISLEKAKDTLSEVEFSWGDEISLTDEEKKALQCVQGILDRVVNVIE